MPFKNEAGEKHHAAPFILCCDENGLTAGLEECCAGQRHADCESWWRRSTQFCMSGWPLARGPCFVHTEMRGLLLVRLTDQAAPGHIAPCRSFQLRFFHPGPCSPQVSLCQLAAAWETRSLCSRNAASDFFSIHIFLISWVLFFWHC